VRTLIRRHVRSVGELELLMLVRAERDRSWSVHEICEALACPPSWAVTHLEAMASAGLLEQAGDGWRFAPAEPELEHATAALEQAYRLRAREVVQFVFAPPGRSSVE
jgi:DNA-binding IclR family transcriptional regulator